VNPQEASQLIDRLGDAFAAADVERVMSMFAAEGDVIYAGSEPGEVAVGQPALRVLLTDLFSRHERYSWRCDSVRTVTCAAGVIVLADVTLFIAEAAVEETGDGSHHSSGTAPYRVSGLLENSTEGWRWRFCHGSEPAYADTDPTQRRADPLGASHPAAV
jgi:ketosteroid isomerase-like protein